MFKPLYRSFISTCQHRSFTTSTFNNKKRQSLPVATTTAAILATACLGYYGWQYFENKGPKALNPDRYIPFDLVQKQKISPDSYRLRVSIKQEENRSYPIPSCLYIKDDTIQVMRPYTPINANPYKDGYIDFIVKRYENGSVSRTISGFEPQADQIHIRGPMTEEYEYRENSLDEIGMIAGGTGISPMYQIIRHILENPNDKNTRIWLIYGNKTMNDILLKSELDELQKKYSDRLNVKYVLEHPPDDNWKDVGYVTKEMIKSMMSQDENIRRKVFVCGPDPMLRWVSGERAIDYSQGQLSGLLSQLGLSSKEVWKFQ
ncbi:NADH-cytochrome b5 reductase [Rhizopus azygosporus]|uniref:NADH-cytochrome b5 reductase n=1 Tax=Rhizopus azygosporus TaxID=86630 RepID=A0A367KG42_RHIAZ|nr:NADH-cytochrome b5 reductase [Rhizopus azygosporus]